jgi:hypothetical protein
MGKILYNHLCHIIYLMKSQICLVLILLCSAAFASNGSFAHSDFDTSSLIGGAKIIVGPFPQQQEKNSIIIIWQTNNYTIENFVEWGLTPNCLYTSYSNTLASGKETDLHSVRIIGLSPNTKYFYRVVSDKTKSDIYSFTTSYEASESITFCVYGDTRGVWDNWRNASIVAEAIEDVQPQFVLHTGDIVHDGLIAEEWIAFFSNSSFIHNSTFYPILGNHENYGAFYFDYFNLGGNERWYSFDNGPVHFIGLDSNDISPFLIRQNVWLIKDLRTNRQPFTIVFFHHPVYSSGKHGSNTQLQWFWQPLFEFFQVDVVYNGHDHAYERGLVNGISYIVAAGGGAPLYDVGSNWWTQYSEKCYHYCLVSANQTHLNIQTIKPDGTIIDSIIINK